MKLLEINNIFYKMKNRKEIWQGFINKRGTIEEVYIGDFEITFTKKQIKVKSLQRISYDVACNCWKEDETRTLHIASIRKSDGAERVSKHCLSTLMDDKIVVYFNRAGTPAIFKSKRYNENKKKEQSERLFQLIGKYE